MSQANDLEAKLTTLYDLAVARDDLGIALQALIQVQYLRQYALSCNYSNSFSYSGPAATGEAPGAESQAPGSEKAP